MIVEPLSGELGQLLHAFTAHADPIGDLVQVESSSSALNRPADLSSQRAELLLETLATGISFAHDVHHLTPGSGLALASAQTQRCVSAEPRQPRDDRIPGAIVPTLPEPAMPMATWRSRRSGAPGAVLDDRDFPAGAHGCRRSCGCLCPRAVAGRASSPASRWWLLPRGTGTLRAMSCSCSPQGSDNPLEVDSRDPMGCGRRERCRRRS